MSLRVFSSFTARLQNRLGAVALEAMLSTVLLFVAFYAMWGVALVIYNQSRVNTATQLSAQSALLIFNRRAYRGQDNGRYTQAFNEAQHAGWSVYRENTCGMLPDEMTGATPSDDCDSPVNQPPHGLIAVSGDAGNPIAIECSPALASGYQKSNCQSAGYLNAAAMRVTTQAQVTSPFDLLLPFSAVGANHQDSVAQLNSKAQAFAFASQGRIH